MSTAIFLAICGLGFYAWKSVTPTKTPATQVETVKADSAKGTK